MTSILKALEAEPRLVMGRRAASSAFATLGLLLLPKCPLCVAAYLMSLGVGVEAAHSAAPFVRPLAWLLVSAAFVALGLAIARARRHTKAAEHAPAARSGCCCS